MKNDKMMSYKGFSGTAEVSVEDGVLFGKVVFINDLVTYEASTFEALTAAFEESVDDYLETCEMIGREPQKPMSGTFNVRVGQELHRKSSIHSINQGMTLNEFVKSALTDKLNESNRSVTVHLDLRNHSSLLQSFDHTSNDINDGFKLSGVFTGERKSDSRSCH